MIVTIHQPDFIPWLGFFQRWKQADLFIILDDVQFLRRGWHHRDKILTRHGVQWLTLPIRKKGRFDQLINEVELDCAILWQNKHLSSFRHAYKNAPEFSDVYANIEHCYRSYSERLMIDLNMALLRYGAQKFDIHTPIKFSSELTTSGKGSQRLLNLLKKVGGTTYLSGLGAKAYLDEHLFFTSNIDVIWMEPKIRPYPQLAENFIPGLSFIDALMMGVNVI